MNVYVRVISVMPNSQKVQLRQQNPRQPRQQNQQLQEVGLCVKVVTEFDK